MDDFKSLLEKQVKKAAGGMPSPVVSTYPLILSEPQAPVSVSPKEVATREEPVNVGIEDFTSDNAGPIVERPISSLPKRELRPGREGMNLNRVTVNLFDADRRALAVIKEKLGSQGHDFTNRSDSIKIGLRLAMKASREDLAAVYEQIKTEDRRFRQ